MLESGEYPTYAEVIELKKEGFDFEEYEATIVPACMKGYSSI